jgi:hypothetical protein
VAPSHLADDFDPNSPTSDQQLVMSASRKDLLPILTFLASKSVVIVGTINWHSVEVLQFAIGPTWSERIPIVVCFDEKEPSKPASLPSSYSGVLTSAGQLRKNFFNLSLWVEPRIELVRWDLTRQIFKWQKAAMQSCSSVLFGTIPNRTAKNFNKKTAIEPIIATSAISPPTLSRCDDRCEYILHGSLACGRCPDMRCVVCELSPRTGEAVRMPGHAGCIAFSKCAHGIEHVKQIAPPKDPPSAAAASDSALPARIVTDLTETADVFNVAVDEFVECPSPVRRIHEVIRPNPEPVAPDLPSALIEPPPLVLHTGLNLIASSVIPLSDDNLPVLSQIQAVRIK